MKNVPKPGWKNPLIIGWAGMRGVVSLASALSIPLLMNDGTAFPHRNLIIFMTFTVIFVTLVLQGLSLPLIIRLISISELDPVAPGHMQHANISIRLNDLALQYLDGRYDPDGRNNSLVAAYKEKLKHDSAGHRQYLASQEFCTNKAVEQKEFLQIMTEIHDLQRTELFKMKKERVFTDEAIRKAEHLLDLNDLRVTESTH